MPKPACPLCPCPSIEEEFTIKAYDLVDTCDEEGKPTAYGEEWVDPNSYTSKGFICSDCGERFEKPLVLTTEEWQKRHEEWTTTQEETAAGAKPIGLVNGNDLLGMLGLNDDA